MRRLLRLSTISTPPSSSAPSTNMIVPMGRPAFFAVEFVAGLVVVPV